MRCAEADGLKSVAHQMPSWNQSLLSGFSEVARLALGSTFAPKPKSSKPAGAARTVSVALAEPRFESLSVATAVRTCDPTRRVRVSEAPVPSAPSRFEDQAMRPDRLPSCASMAVARSETPWPDGTVAPAAGDWIVTTGGFPMAGPTVKTSSGLPLVASRLRYWVESGEVLLIAKL